MPSLRAITRSTGHRAGVVVLLFALLGLPGLLDGRGAGAAPGVDWSKAIVAQAQGVALTAPTPLQTEATAGPWRMTVQEVVTGDDAVSRVTGASPSNVPPPNGSTYVIARVTVINAGAEPYRIHSDDFATVDGSGKVFRFTGAVAPDPALDGTVAPGDSLDGWIVVGTTAGESDLVLLYDSTSITGDWADAVFALAGDPAVAAASDRAVPINDTGRDPGSPAGPNTPLATDDWVVELLEVRFGADVAALYPPEDYRTTALIGGDPSVAGTWIAVRVRITNNRTGAAPQHLSESAFTLADGDGNAVPDLSTLTPPEPDIAAEYLPGATREGWVVFDAIGYGGALLRFQSFRIDGDVRYFSWSGGTGTAQPSEPTFEGTLEPGTTVVTTESQVRLRAEPSTSSEIVAEMPAGTVLTITGAPESGSDLTWYPVEDPATGETGYVAQQLIEPRD